MVRSWWVFSQPLLSEERQGLREDLPASHNLTVSQTPQKGRVARRPPSQHFTISQSHNPCLSSRGGGVVRRPPPISQTHILTTPSGPEGGRVVRSPPRVSHYHKLLTHASPQRHGLREDPPESHNLTFAQFPQRGQVVRTPPRISRSHILSTPSEGRGCEKTSHIITISNAHNPLRGKGL